MFSVLESLLFRICLCHCTWIRWEVPVSIVSCRQKGVFLAKPLGFWVRWHRGVCQGSFCWLPLFSPKWLCVLNEKSQSFTGTWVKALCVCRNGSGIIMGFQSFPWIPTYPLSFPDLMVYVVCLSLTVLGVAIVIKIVRKFKGKNIDKYLNIKQHFKWLDYSFKYI